MKIAVLSDIHGNLHALQAVLADVARQGVDATVNLGDLLSGPLQPAETADCLMALQASGTVTLAGNHERQLLAVWDAGPQQADAGTSDGYAATCITPAHAKWLRRLQPAQWLDIDVLLVHGTPASDCTYWLESTDPSATDGMRQASPEETLQRLRSQPGADEARLVLCGHTHVPRTAVADGTLIVNPGSVGLQAYHDDQPIPHRVQTGTPHARYAIVSRDATGAWRNEARSVAYDWDAQARIAAARGRPDWAQALATGRLPVA